MSRFLLSLFFIFGCAGCFGAPVFDASTEKSIKDSFHSMSQGLPDKKKEKLNNALMYYMFGGLEGFDSLLKNAFNGGEDKTELFVSVNLQSIHNLTADEILAKHDEDLKRIKQLQLKSEAEIAKFIKERNEVTKLIEKAEKLLEDKQFEESISIYKKLSELPYGYNDGLVGIEKAKNEMKIHSEKMDYIENIEITEFKASRVDTYSNEGIPAFRVSLKNKGNRSLDKVKVIVYFYDSNGNVIYEEDYHPILVTKYSSSSKPLKPGYVSEMPVNRYYTLDSTLTDWDESKATIEIVDIEFSN